MSKSVIVVGTGNAAMCAAIAALEEGAQVLMLEKADEALSGGNTKYTAGAMRFAYDGNADLLPLVRDQDDPRLPHTDFGSYTTEKFGADLLGFNDGRPLSPEQEVLIHQSGDTMRWLATHGVTFEPIYSRQSFEKDGKHIFWGGLTLAAENEGVGLFDMELAAVTKMGGKVRYDSAVTGLIVEDARVIGVRRVRGQRRTARQIHRFPLGRRQSARHTAQHRRRLANGAGGRRGRIRLLRGLSRHAYGSAHGRLRRARPARWRAQELP